MVQSFLDAAASPVLHLEPFDFVILFRHRMSLLDWLLMFLDLAPTVEADRLVCDLIFSGQQVQRTWSDFDGALLQPGMSELIIPLTKVKRTL